MSNASGVQEDGVGDVVARLGALPCWRGSGREMIVGVRNDVEIFPLLEAD